jgi:hypothetical protein
VNRSERRRNKIKKTQQKDAVLCIKKSELEQKLQESYQKGYENAKKAVTDEVTAEVFTMLLGLPMVVLKDQYGWGFRKRLPRFADQVIAEYMKFDKVKSLKELQDFIYESYGMKFIVDEA